MSRILLLLAALAAFLACMGPAAAARLTIAGDVTYRERVALPPAATLTVSLVDLAAPKSAGPTATAEVAEQGGVPLHFTLNLDDSVILAGHKYGLMARIGDQSGTIWFHNREPFPVDPRASGQQIVILVTPSASAAKAPPAVDTTPLMNVTWQAESIGGKPVAPGSVSSLSIADDMRAGGRGGCNSWFAQAELVGDTLAFSEVAATRMACLSDALSAQETGFFAALAATKRWQVREGRLHLLDGAGGDLAVLAHSRF